MSQAYTTPVGTDARSTSIKTTIPNCLEALRSLFSGATAPTNPIAYQLWADTSTGLLKQRNGANSAWEIVGALAVNSARVVDRGEFASLSASANRYFVPPASSFVVERVILTSDTSSSSSSGNEWQWQLHNLTAANQLFTAAVGTFTTLGGVGGGELAANTPQFLIPNQNATILANAQLEFRAVKVGTVTTLTRFSVWLQGYPKG